MSTFHCSFSGDFRGTKVSLKRLIDEERFQRPLLLDLWQFYRAERLYLLRLLKEILSHSHDVNHPHQKQFAKALKEMGKDDALGKSLLE